MYRANGHFFQLKSPQNVIANFVEEQKQVIFH